MIVSIIIVKSYLVKFLNLGQLPGYLKDDIVKVSLLYAFGEINTMFVEHSTWNFTPNSTPSFYK